MFVRRPSIFDLYSLSGDHAERHEFAFRVRQAGAGGTFYNRDPGLLTNIVARDEKEALDIFLRGFDLRQTWEVLVGNLSTGEVAYFKVEPPPPSRPKIDRI